MVFTTAIFGRTKELSSISESSPIKPGSASCGELIVKDQYIERSVPRLIE